MKKSALLLLLFTLPAPSPSQTPSSKLSAPQLIALAKANDPKLPAAIASTFDLKELKDGTAWAGKGADFFFAIKSAKKPLLVVDEKAGASMQQAGGAESDIWYATRSLGEGFPAGRMAQDDPSKPEIYFPGTPEVGKLHAFYYVIDGKPFGGRLDLPAYGPLSYLQPGVPSGKLSEKITHISKIYEGMKSNYWIYVPAQYDPKTPAALMVFQDGEGYAKRTGDAGADHGILNVIDNLIAMKKIPVMICVFINPGDVTDAPGTPTYNLIKAHADRVHRTIPDATRSTLYDTVSDRYDRYLGDEILADVGKQYSIRPDAYSRAITGLSSGGICAFNAAWQMPDQVAQFSRVISWIGSFTSIQWHERPDVSEGGQDYPDKVLRESHRNIRVWLQDGSNDMENPNWGSWPLANIRMANALKAKGYDFHFSFGKGTHNASHGAAEFPEEMIWLWRDYIVSKSEQTYEIENSEKSQSYYRVTITNRHAD